MAHTPLSRRAFLLTAGAARIGMPEAGLAPARELVRSGALGQIVFCRAFQGDGGDSLGALQFLLDAPSPVSVTEHGAGLGTLRYPGFIASYEKDRGRREYGIVICGSHATLVVQPDGWRVFGREAEYISPSRDRKGAFLQVTYLARRHGWISNGFASIA